MARHHLAGAAAAVLLSASAAHAAAIPNGGFTVNTSSSQIGIVPDSTGFSNLVLQSGVPQSTDLFDIFALSTVSTQPIGVAFDLVQTGVGAISAVVSGSVSASSGADDMASVSFVPITVVVPSYGTLSISLSGAAFANDFNGTVIATLVETVPEPCSAALLGCGLAALAGVAGVGRRRAGRAA